MIKKVVLFTGGIETLDYFSYQMGEAYKNMGLSVFYFDLKDGESCGRRVRKFIKSGETIMVTFNFEGLEREDGVFSINNGYIWQGYDLPIFNIIADHPYFYDNRFKDLLDDEKLFPGILKHYRHVSIDKNHELYQRRFYPEFKDGGFLPLAGNMLLSDKLRNSEDYLRKLKPIKDRKTTILFTGNYTELSFFDKFIHAINEEYASFYEGIIEDILKNPWKTVEEVEIAHCEAEMGKQPDSEYTLALHRMVFIDLYVRNYFRGQVIEELVKEGFPVTVIGKDWDKLKVGNAKNLTILQQTDSASCLRALQDAKVSLNVMPWFKDGAHDRVFNSILNGAVCLSDGSKYQNMVLPEGSGVSYYDLKEMNVCGRMTELLADEDKLQHMVLEGYGKVVQSHTWGDRAEELLERV